MNGRRRASQRQKRRYPVAILGAFGIDNFGNDATLDAVMHSLPRIESGEVLCVCSEVEYVRSRFNLDGDYLHGPPKPHPWTYSTNRALRSVSRVPRELHRFVSAYRRMRDVEVLVVAGTGCLDDQHVGPTGLPLDMAIWCVAARAAGAHVTMLSVGAGPIDHKLSRVLLRGAARAAHFISYRDTMSRDYMRSIGRDVSHDEVSTDLVFGLPPAPAGRRDVATPTVAIGVLWSGNWADRPDARDRYRDHLVELVALLWDAGNNVALIIGDAADTESRDDLLNALEKRDSERARQRLECPPLRSFDDVLRTMARCDAAVVSRYHNIVAALMTATPVISLEYGFKNRALMSSAGLAEWCLHIDDFDPVDVAGRVASAGPEVAVEERRAVEALRRDVEEQFADVLNRVEP